MAITDWTRTNLNWRLPNGGTALRFDAVDFAAYDLFILERDGAEADYFARQDRRREGPLRGDVGGQERRARARADRLAAGARLRLRPREFSPRACSATGTSASRTMRANLIAFVREITEVAEEEGARLAIHPDDPAFPIFGLPRVLSTAEDVRRLFAAVPSEACGLTLCAGSFGSNLQERSRRHGARVRRPCPFRAFAQRQP